MVNAVSVEVVATKILEIRGKKVMLDKDLAVLYGIKPIALRQQVKRNQKRFPEDFMFKLTSKEVELMVSQNVIPSKRSMGGYLPKAFTEHGILMLSSILNSRRAITVNIQIMRTFSRLRQMIASHSELKRKIEEMENKYDRQFKIVFEAVKNLMAVPDKSKKRIGFYKD